MCSKLTNSYVYLQTLLPRGQYPYAGRTTVLGVDDLLIQKFKNDPNDELIRNVYLVEIQNNIVQADGSIPTSLMADFLHPTDYGYTFIFTAVQDKIINILYGV